MRMEEENSREAAEKLQQIGSSILGAARDELYLGMRFLDVALSSFVYQMDSSVSPFGTDGAVIYFHPQQIGGLYRQNRTWCFTVFSGILSNRAWTGAIGI